MYYMLNPDIALRSWRKVPYAYYVKHVRNAYGLKQEEFEFLVACDGQTELPSPEESELAKSLLQRKLISQTEKGTSPDSWSRLRICENRYFPAMNWMITGKCNYNCRHCFNAADNARLQSEFTMEQAQRLICQAETCGINEFTITGGEPMLHPHFMEILQSIYAHGMYVGELNTNGYFLTQAILDEMKAMGCDPLMKISFDGVGCHDWLRNRTGAEKDAIRAIRLCIDNGFRVKAQTNVHRLNLHSMIPTAKLLSELGVEEMRIIRTTEAPRWVQNAGNACLTLEEYFDYMLLFLQEYVGMGSAMTIDVWQFVRVSPIRKTYRPRAMECREGEYRDSLPVCRGNRGMVAVAADGNLYPCHQLSGYYQQNNWFLGNVIADGLQPFLQEGAYLQEICTTVGELAQKNQKCGSCKWFPYCCGGCRALGTALTGDKLGADPTKCLFFTHGYLDKLQDVLQDYENLYPISVEFCKKIITESTLV